MTKISAVVGIGCLITAIAHWVVPTGCFGIGFHACRGHVRGRSTTRFGRLIKIACALAALDFAVGPTGAQTTIGVTSTVDSAGNVGTYNFLALKCSGLPIISYFDPPTGNSNTPAIMAARGAFPWWTMTDTPAHAVSPNSDRNQLHISDVGHVTSTALKACRTRVEMLLPAMRPGFTVLTDLSGLESMDLDCVTDLAKIKDRFRVAGVGLAGRVIPNSDKDIGFNVLSLIHRQRGVKIVTCETRAEAELVLKVT